MASRALIIGSGHYTPDSGILSHPTIRVSADMYRQILATDPMWDSVTVLSPREVETVDSVMRALEAVARDTEAADRLLVVYVGHGHYWSDLEQAQVHFAVGSSHRRRPWTWLSSWYVYRAIRAAKAGLKVLIADCCYSDLLPNLGPEPDLPGVLGAAHEGTCVFTAVKSVNAASAVGCDALPGDLRVCTPFSGHLLNVLWHGTEHNNSALTIGLLRDAVQTEMGECEASQHHAPRMVLNDARESTPLFTNRMAPDMRVPNPRAPTTVAEWVTALRRNWEYHSPSVLRDPRMCADVVNRLRGQGDEASQELAQRLHARAAAELRPAAFARYWNRLSQRDDDA